MNAVPLTHCNTHALPLGSFLSPFLQLFNANIKATKAAAAATKAPARKR